MQPALRRFGFSNLWYSVFATLLAAVCFTASAQGTKPATVVEAPAADRSARSLVAEALWSNSKNRLIRIRIVPLGQSSQISVGSGFFVSAQGLIVSNFHVVSQVALKPQKYEIQYELPDGEKGRLVLLAVDVVHDLSLLRTVPAAGSAAKLRDAFAFRAPGEALVRGERIYSLGNPLDVGFAVVEGTYNGLVERSFLPNLFFSGAMNGGMSGGPAVDAAGQVIGVNVAKRSDGEQVSFLVPAEHAVRLVASGSAAPTAVKGPGKSLYREVTQQLVAHQNALTKQFLAQAWKAQIHGKVAVPVPADGFFRCWGSREPSEAKSFQVAGTRCRMESQIYTGDGSAGFYSTQYEAYDGEKLGTARFMDRYTRSFQNEYFPPSVRPATKPLCEEGFVQAPSGPPLRTVVCMQAYKRFAGLYQLSVLVATLNEDTRGVLSRFNASGVSMDNAKKLTAHFLAGFVWAP